jgi:hypothetical protein
MRIRDPGRKKFGSGMFYPGSLLDIGCHHAYVYLVHYLYIRKYLLMPQKYFLLDTFQAPRMGKRGGALVAAVLAALVRAGNALCPASCHCQLQFTVVQCLHAGLEVRTYVYDADFSFNFTKEHVNNGRFPVRVH